MLDASVAAALISGRSLPDGTKCGSPEEDKFCVRGKCQVKKTKIKYSQCCQIWYNYTNLVYLDINFLGKFSSGVILFLVIFESGGKSRVFWGKSGVSFWKLSGNTDYSGNPKNALD